MRKNEIYAELFEIAPTSYYNWLKSHKKLIKFFNDFFDAEDIDYYNRTGKLDKLKSEGSNNDYFVYHLKQLQNKMESRLLDCNVTHDWDEMRAMFYEYKEATKTYTYSIIEFLDFYKNTLDDDKYSDVMYIVNALNNLEFRFYITNI